MHYGPRERTAEQGERVSLLDFRLLVRFLPPTHGVVVLTGLGHASSGPRLLHRVGAVLAALGDVGRQALHEPRSPRPSPAFRVLQNVELPHE